MKSILMSASHSGAGKTTVSLGIMHALRLRGLHVQAFKIGPDYIDARWHKAATGHASRNLDEYLMPPTLMRALFAKHSACADISVIEGAMGLYDGYGSDPHYCSSAGIAKQLDVPIILVLDCKGTSTSIAAILHGFMHFDQQTTIQAVILNRVNTANHYQLLKTAIEKYCAIPVLGRMPTASQLILPSRQLGLVSEINLMENQAYWQALAQYTEQYIDLDALLEISHCAQIQHQHQHTLSTAQNSACSPLPTTINPSKNRYLGLKIAVAFDDAFHFYYQDNLDLLRELGASLIFFSPLHDTALPHCDAIYIGGGFPEIFAPQISANTTLLNQLNEAHQLGIPIYAECGGLMLLGQSLIDDQGQSHVMTGILSGYSQMTKTLKRFGYCQGIALCDTLLARKGEILRGHEFHHSEFISDEPCVMHMQKVIEGEVVKSWKGGYQLGNTFASYLHVHFYQHVDMLHHWLTRTPQHDYIEVQQ